MGRDRIDELGQGSVLDDAALYWFIVNWNLPPHSLM